MISFLASELKKLSDYETLKQNELEAWITRVIMKDTNKACYMTAEDYFEAVELNKKIIKILTQCKSAILFSSGTHDDPLTLIEQVEKMIERLKEKTASSQ